MFRKKFLLTLAFCMLLLCSNIEAISKVKILVNNSEIYSDVEPFLINDTTYVPLRFVSNALNVKEISWNQNAQAITIKQGNTTLKFFINKSYAYINNKYTSLKGMPLLKDNRTFVPLRIISETLGATVNWNSDTHTVFIDTPKSSNTSQNNSTSSNSSQSGTSSNNSSNKPSSGSSSAGSSSSKPSQGTSSSSKPDSNTTISVTEDAIFWLARIIEAEASGEPNKGKVAVGEVILNRVKSNEFPNTIWGVIFDNTYAIQFEPVANGTIYNTPSEASITAAKEALSGSNYVNGALYFLNPRTASSSWIAKNRKFCMTIANHDFYY